tara:strand:- start:482 stop:1924 length:1443 start_codon:yes stop_codon:yes gene_type:complete
MSCKELNDPSLRPHCIDQENTGIFKPHNESIGHYRTGAKCSRFHMNVNYDIDKQGTYKVPVGYEYQDAYNYEYNNNGVEYEPGESKIGKTGHNFEIENNKYVPSPYGIKIGGTPYTVGINNYKRNIEKGKCYEKKRTLRMNSPGKCPPTHNQKAQCPPNIVPFKFDESNILQIKKDVHKKIIEPKRRKIYSLMIKASNEVSKWRFIIGYKHFLYHPHRKIRDTVRHYYNIYIRAVKSYDRNKNIYNLSDFNNINKININNINQYPSEVKKYYNYYNNEVNNLISIEKEKQLNEHNSELQKILDSNDNYFGCDIDNIEDSGLSCNIVNDYSYTLHECGDDCHNFTEWGSCSVPCGGGIQTRKCTDGLERGLSECEGSDADWERSCNTQECPIDCVVSDWYESKKCGPCRKAYKGRGTRELSRIIKIQPNTTGEKCPNDLKKIETCKIDDLKKCYSDKFKESHSIDTESINKKVQKFINLFI